MPQVTMQIKVFSNAYEAQSQLESEVNEFLQEIGIKVVDVKFTEAMAHNTNTEEMDLLARQHNS